MIVPIILAGGTGSRLWPSSREHHPKQLLTLVGENSLLQETLKRIQKLPDLEDPIIICNSQYRFLVAEQMLEMGIKNPKLILESIGRNTAPAVAMAALCVQKLFPDTDPVLLILPADHLIQNHEAFLEGVETARAFAKQHLVTFGIRPTSPQTGYGYIEIGKMISEKVYEIIKFVEKPQIEQAKAYIEAENYYWNSGMFLFSAQTYLAELKTYCPDIFKMCDQEQHKIREADGFFFLSDSFRECPSESIDYAIMEKTTRALILPLEVSWSDIGSWTALHDVLPRDENHNILQGDVTCIDTKNCFIRGEHRLIATIGLENHIVIETMDAVMIAHKDYAQKVKDVVAELKIAERKEIEYHAIVNRPWGNYQVLVENLYFKIKLVHIKPKGALHLQRHHHRSEHWVILEGSAIVEVDGTRLVLKKSESTFIEKGAAHQLKNASANEQLDVLEIQVGDILAESDTETLD